MLNTDGRDIRTKKKFSNYTARVEFLEPYRPLARGQGRGNSGFYQVDMYEVQIAPGPAERSRSDRPAATRSAKG